LDKRINIHLPVILINNEGVGGVLLKCQRMRVFMTLKAMDANTTAQLSKVLYCNGRLQGLLLRFHDRD